jgi:hypothetical protein
MALLFVSSTHPSQRTSGSDGCGSDDDEIKELSLEGGDPGTIAPNKSFTKESQLAATRGTDGTRYIAYQLKDNTIEIWNVEENAGTLIYYSCRQSQIV